MLYPLSYEGGERQHRAITRVSTGRTGEPSGGRTRHAGMPTASTTPMPGSRPLRTDDLVVEPAEGKPGEILDKATPTVQPAEPALPCDEAFCSNSRLSTLPDGLRGKGSAVITHWVGTL